MPSPNSDGERGRIVRAEESEDRPRMRMFDRYLTDDLADDLRWILGAVEPMHHGTEEQADGGVTLQPAMLTTANRRIRAMRLEQRDLLALGIFWTVLLDQVVYSDCREKYEAFRAATRFPKLKAPCSIAYRQHMHPSVALAVTGISTKGDGCFPAPSSRRARLAHATATEVERYLEGLDHGGGASFPSALWPQVLRELPFG